MIYMFKLSMVVTTVVFGFAGLAIAAMFAWNEARQYANALRAMSRIAVPARRESLAISRTHSRNHDLNSIHAA
jgi:hypothetical protein